MYENDSIAIKKYLNGDEDALTWLVKKHIDHVYAFCIRLVQDPHVAEDLTQQTFVNAWKHLHSFDTNRRFLTWLLAIARNATTDYLRKCKSIPFAALGADTQGDGLVDTLSDPEPLPDELFARKELRTMLAHALLRLSVHERELLILHYIHELTFTEIADITHVSRDTLKSQHRRVLAKLRALLATPDAPNSESPTYI